MLDLGSNAARFVLARIRPGAWLHDPGGGASADASGRRASLVVDLGGGSLQITKLRRGEALAAVSLPLGAVRADIIVAGAVIVEELMAIGGYEFLTVCVHGVRHGVLVEETFGRVTSP